MDDSISKILTLARSCHFKVSICGKPHY